MSDDEESSSSSSDEESQMACDYDMDPRGPRGGGGVSDPILIDTDEQFNQDKDRVRNRVLRQIDATYLAPRRSPLFRRMYKKMKNADGSRSLKKNADIVMPRFRKLMKETLRPLLSNLGQQKPLIAERLFYAALAIVKKRRANHVQAWRRFGRSKRLIYGGRGPFNNCAYVTEKHGDIHCDEEDTTTTPQSSVSVKVDPGVLRGAGHTHSHPLFPSPPPPCPSPSPPLSLTNHSHTHLFPGVAAIAPANMTADFPAIKSEGKHLGELDPPPTSLYHELTSLLSSLHY